MVSEAAELLASGNTFTARATRLAFPIVLARAMAGLPITYGKLNIEVRARGEKAGGHRNYNGVAGKIGDICEILQVELGREVPPLNAIIINEKSKLPSYGADDYLARFFKLTEAQIKKLNKTDRDSYAAAARDRVLDYVGWEEIGRYLGLKVPKTRITTSRGDGLPDGRKFHRGPESAAHKRLKAWLCEHPEAVVGFGVFGKGSPEYEIASGDRLDVLFSNRTALLAAEVKSCNSSADEVERGVYQCVKYRATLRAMQTVEGMPPNAQAVLVLDGPPSGRIAATALKLTVRIITVSVPDT